MKGNIVAVERKWIRWRQWKSRYHNQEKWMVRVYAIFKRCNKYLRLIKFKLVWFETLTLLLCKKKGKIDSQSNVEMKTPGLRTLFRDYYIFPNLILVIYLLGHYLRIHKKISSKKKESTKNNRNKREIQICIIVCVHTINISFFLIKTKLEYNLLR